MFVILHPKTKIGFHNNDKFMSNISSSVFEIVNMFRVYGNYEQSLNAIYYILYCLHKKYRIYFKYDEDAKVSDISIVSEDGQHLKDVVISDYPVANIVPAFFGWSDKEVEKFLVVLSGLIIEEEYSVIIENLVPLFAETSGRMAWDSALPVNVVKLVCKISSILSCDSVYNPFPKNGLFAINLESSSYVGEEWNLVNATITRIQLDANNISPRKIKLGNPMTHPFPDECDSVISIPPFMLKQMGAEKVYTGKSHRTYTVEDYLLWRFLENDKCRKGIFVFPAGLGFTPRYKEVREAITKAGCIDSIISLPAGIFYGTAISTLVLVLNKDKKDSMVKFIDGTKYYLKDIKKNILDVDTIFSQYINPSSSLVYWSSEQELFDKDYSFSPAMYATYKDVIPDGYKEFGFDEVFRIPQMTLCSPFEKGYVLSPADFSQDYLAIMESRKEKGLPDTHTYRKSLEPINLAISFLNDTMKVARLEADASAFANSNQIPLVLREDSPIVLDYAIFSLLHNNQFRNLAKCYTGMQLRRARDLTKYLQTIRLLAPSQKDMQKSEVSRVLDSLKQEKVQLLKDELTRLGTRETVSDLSHMMNTPFSNIGDLLGVLLDEEMSDNAKTWIVQLKDNFEYLIRLIKTVGADFSIDACPMENIEIQSFLNEYIQSWSNISNHFFKTELISNLSSDDLSVRGNKTLIRIALDCIFKNAQRHGFNNKYSEDNKVSIDLSEVSLFDKPFVCVSITNNGEPFPETFTIKDFIKRGKVAGNSGKTGLGGYHVYSIIKKLEGYLNLANDGNGDVIFELLIPAPGLSLKTLTAYNNAENCL